MTESKPVLKKESARDRLAARFRSLCGEPGPAFARALLDADSRTGRMVCWGELLPRFESAFATDEQRIEALSVLVNEGDLRALLLFAHSARKRSAVLDALLARASELPVSIQRALIALVPTSAWSAEIRDSLAPSAQQLLLQGEDSIARERETVEARIAALLSFGVIAPDSVEPREGERGPTGWKDDIGTGAR